MLHEINATYIEVVCRDCRWRVPKLLRGGEHEPMPTLTKAIASARRHAGIPGHRAKVRIVNVIQLQKEEP